MASLSISDNCVNLFAVVSHVFLETKECKYLCLSASSLYFPSTGYGVDDSSSSLSGSSSDSEETLYDHMYEARFAATVRQDCAYSALRRLAEEGLEEEA